ncbi:MAG TPA: condensation domain-containing protein, partial [Mycobacteriales bacterium]|nr:condensation domain-containing protein [Mycobacteriales bacterium]
MTDQIDIPVPSIMDDLPVVDIGPLSFQQEQLWFLDQLAPGQQTYNLPAGLRLLGPLDIPALSAALTEVVRRHGTLRTTFTTQGDRPVQRVAAPAPVTLSAEPLPAGYTPADLVRAEARRPFDLATGPLFRARLFRVGPDDHLLTLMTHHTCSDGWSTGLLADELTACYTAATGPGGVAGLAAPVPGLPDLPVQYVDYARTQRERLRGAVLDAELRYWEGKLTGASVLELPTDRPRPAVPSYRGEAVWYQVPGEVVNGLRALAGGRRVSLFMTLLAAFQVVLARYTGQDDIVVGTASAERDTPEYRSLIGFFTNMLVLRTDLSGSPTFTELLDRVREVTLDAYEHQEVPFEKLVERIAPRRDPSRNPLFQVAFGLLPPRLGERSTTSGALRTDLVIPDVGVSRFDIAVNAQEVADGLEIWLEYSTDLFDRSRMDRMMGHFERVLRAVVADPSVRLSAVDILTPPERCRVLDRWQPVTRDYRRELVHAMVVEQAGRTPEETAVVFGDQSMTYAELERRSGRLARCLRARGVGGGDVVGVAVGRGVDVPWLLLGVLRAGAAFVPVDLSHPAERVGYVLADSGARVVLCTTADLPRVPAGDRDTVCVDSAGFGAELSAHAGDRLVETASLGSGCYLLYTSGSTGRPKGVLVEHHALATYLDF